MDWGTIIFGVLALAFVVLIIQAILQMRVPVEDDDEEQPAVTKPADDKGGESADKDAHKDTPKEPRKAPDPEPKPEADESKKKGHKKVDRAEERRRLSKGLAKTRGGFIAKLGGLFRGKRELDADLLDKVEEILFTADIGVRTSEELLDNIRKELGKQELSSPEAIWGRIKQRSAEILDQPGAGALTVKGETKPFVILVIGVNGTGKTTTIGKLAARFRDEGHKVLLAAADTFRAAAVDQLQIWGERAGAEVVSGKAGADPSSVIVDALKRAKELDVDVVLADTAGRLHTKADLMDELQKVGRSISKWVEGAPHETVLVLDSTMGQNAIAQARLFKEAMDISGIILTKLDGTAKGGVVLGICHELQLPVRYIGIGEQVDDLRAFEPGAFVEALYEDADADGEHG